MSRRNHKKEEDQSLSLKRKEFSRRLKDHLSNEYMMLNEKKMNLETESIQIRMEMDQRDKSLFPGMKKRDYRKYFSPLNLSEEDHKKQNEIDEKYANQMSELNEEISNLDARMDEIKVFIKEIDTLFV